LLIRLQEYTESEKLLIILLDRYQGDSELDHIHFLLAGIYRDLQNWEQAMEQYRQILVAYPNSFFTEEAREQARMITTQLKPEKNP
jgi:outer membrane protein assembly factor BamD (BamD/ComL family)